jgi:glutamine amidotransferase
MQLMCKSSEEGVLPGLGWIDAEVRRFSFPEGAEQKIPHMGWNTVRVAKPNPLIAEGDDEQRFYFVHSYHAVCADPGDVLATTRHGGEVTAAFSRGNIYGAQFHPEKSHRFGMALMQRFVELPC